MSDYYAKLLVESVFLIGVLCAITLFKYMFKNSTLMHGLCLITTLNY